uniref:Nuclear receptor domain-containing protein n=1 Tax=Globodera pallida TaxID=36090 RepID=A0A183BV90_GLOPA
MDQQQLPDSSPDSSAGRGAAGECRVCGAGGAARHYGSVCCSGCKGFFRRSVRFQKVYRCLNLYVGQCAISKLYRNCCRACRLRKCLCIGLDPNLVHGDWGQNGAGGRPFVLSEFATNPPRRTAAPPAVPPDSVKAQPPESEPNLPELLFQQASPGAPHKNVSLVQQHQFVVNFEQSTAALGFSKERIEPAGNDCVALSKYFLAVERLCDLYVEFPLPASCNPSSISSTLYSLDVPVEVALKQPGKVSARTPIDWGGQQLISKETMARSYCRLIVHYFDWVSYVPELSELTEEDRKTQIIKRAMRCVWLLCSFRSALLNIDGVSGCCECMFPYSLEQRERLDPELKSIFLDSATMAFTELVVPFRELRLTDERGRAQVARARDKYLSCLSDLIRRSEANGADSAGEGAMGRMSRLMMFLATVEQVAQLGDNAFAMLNVFNVAGMRGLLTYDIHIRAIEQGAPSPPETRFGKQ